VRFSNAATHLRNLSISGIKNCVAFLVRAALERNRTAAIVDSCEFSVVSHPYLPVGTERAAVLVAAPLSPPGKITLTQTTPTDVVLAWPTIPIEKRNGIVTYYNIRLESSGICGPNRVLSSTSAFVSLVGLKPMCRYSAFVSGCTSAGCGPRSELRDFTSVQKSKLASAATSAFGFHESVLTYSTAFLYTTSMAVW